MNSKELEQTILDAAAQNADNLQDLLQMAIETMEEEQANRLLDKVMQIFREGLREARGWKEDVEEDAS